MPEMMPPDLLLRLGRILFILGLAIVALQLTRRGLPHLREIIDRRQGNREDSQRVRTLSRVFRYVLNVVISLIACMSVLNEIGISVAPILGAAGIVGLAVGFGAQSLVKDYFTGLFPHRKLVFSHATGRPRPARPDEVAMD